jgi:hypothetical protein
MTFMLTRIDVRDYDAWKPMFEQDKPRARELSKGWRIFRNVENPNEVFLQIEFETTADAMTSRERLLSSGVLDRFDDKSGPTIVEESEVVRR